MSFLIRALRIFKDAVFTPSLPLRTRALLLILQPITLLTYTIEWAISRKFPHSSEIRIPIKGTRKSGHTLRAVVYTPKPKPPTSQVPVSASPQPQKVPLHLNIHGGAFLGGLPEGNARFCHRLAEKSGAVVVSTSYRYAPAHTFPASHEDVRDVAEYLLQNAERLWGADPAVFTVSGFSVGGNLAFSVAQELSGSGAVKGLVSFEGVVDFRLPPWDKPKPPDFPAVDPLAILQPLFDAYAGPNRARDMGNPLLHPTLADLSALPQNVLFVVGGADILRDETVKMAERLEQEAEGSNRERKLDTPDEPDGTAAVVRMNVAEGQIHGWTELPSFAIDEALRTKAFDDAISFLRAVHRSYGFVA